MDVTSNHMEVNHFYKAYKFGTFFSQWSIQLEQYIWPFWTFLVALDNVILVDLIRLIIDPMKNLFLGSAKHFWNSETHFMCYNPV